jgi:hypothetical protein
MTARTAGAPLARLKTSGYALPPHSDDPKYASYQRLGSSIGD